MLTTRGTWQNSSSPSRFLGGVAAQYRAAYSANGQVMARVFGSSAGFDSLPYGYSEVGRGSAPAMKSGGIAGRVFGVSNPSGVLIGIGRLLGSVQGQTVLSGVMNKVLLLAGTVVTVSSLAAALSGVGALVGRVQIGAPPDTDSIADAILGNRIYPNGPTLGAAITDILAGVNQGGAGVTTQQIRDAMALALSLSVTPVVGSIDEKLGNISDKPFIDAG